MTTRVPITTIRQAEAIQDAFNRTADDEVVRIRGLHPEIDEVQPLFLSEAEEPCDSCNCIQIVTRGSQTGIRQTVCREVINALRLASLKHNNSDYVCLDCQIQYDDLGMIISASHVTFDRPGLESAITAGRVFREGDRIVIDP